MLLFQPPPPFTNTHAPSFTNQPPPPPPPLHHAQEDGVQIMTDKLQASKEGAAMQIALGPGKVSLCPSLN